MTYILHNNTHMGMLHTHYWSYGGVVRAPDTRAERMCSVQKRPADAREAPHAKSDPTRLSHARGPGDHRRPGGQALAVRTARTARENVRPSTRPQRCTASKSKRARAADAAAARCQRHLPVGICKQT